MKDFIRIVYIWFCLLPAVRRQVKAVYHKKYQRTTDTVKLSEHLRALVQLYKVRK